jgi:concentrative nucleoside transporter, CNT family
MDIAMNLLGIALLLAVALLLSSDRRAIRLRVVAAAFALQAGFAALVLYVPAGNRALQALAFGVTSLLGYAREGTAFVFGELAGDRLGQNFAFTALPTIIFLAALIGILYHLRIMPLAIRWIGGAIARVTGISRVESLYAASNIFVGMSESPLVISPYIARLQPSQLFCAMVVGLAGVAGTILALYVSIGIRADYLVAAAFMSAPGGILMAKLMMPDPPDMAEMALRDDEVTPHEGDDRPTNFIMAAAQGAMTGVKLAVAVGAMVLAFVALIALANGLFGWLGGLAGFGEITFQRLAGYIFAPVFWLLGSQDWAEAMLAGGFFGTKLVLNEVIAFMAVSDAKGLSERMQAVVIFSLCGFANFGSIAIQMAVLGGLAPKQRPLIGKLALRALAAASLANIMSAALAGLFVSL